MMGIKLFFGDTAVTPLASIFVLIGTAAVFYILAVLNLSRKSR